MENKDANTDCHKFVMAGKQKFKLNVTKRSAKIIKAVEEHPPRLGKTLGNLEMTQKKIHFQRFFALKEQRKWS